MEIVDVQPPSIPQTPTSDHDGANVQHCRETSRAIVKRDRTPVLGRLIVATEVLMAQWYGSSLEVGRT